MRRRSLSSAAGLAQVTLATAKRHWLVLILLAWLSVSIFPAISALRSRPAYLSPTPDVVTKTIVMAAVPPTAVPHALQEGVSPINRHQDMRNAFEDYHTAPGCNFSSLELHGPFEPLCQNKESLLYAMSWGGRLGFDAPYSPRGCDMRWFSPMEICGIMSRFSKVFIIGDSLMRNLAVAMHVHFRADLVHGGEAGWFPYTGKDVGLDCMCKEIIETKECVYHGVVSTPGVWLNDPDSMLCPQEDTGSFQFMTFTAFPLKQRDLDIFMSHLPAEKPKKPIAFVMGHGLWNDLKAEKTYDWVHQVHNTTIFKAPWLEEEGSLFPRLFITPHAAGEQKADIFILHQGQIAVSRFEKKVGAWIRDKPGYDHLGTYNMSIQASSMDGTHGTFKGNLLKSMMIYNWLNAFDLSGWDPTFHPETRPKPSAGPKASEAAGADAGKTEQNQNGKSEDGKSKDVKLEDGTPQDSSVENVKSKAVKSDSDESGHRKPDHQESGDRPSEDGKPASRKTEDNSGKDARGNHGQTT